LVGHQLRGGHATTELSPLLGLIFGIIRHTKLFPSIYPNSRWRYSYFQELSGDFLPRGLTGLQRSSRQFATCTSRLPNPRAACDPGFFSVARDVLSS